MLTQHSPEECSAPLMEKSQQQCCKLWDGRDEAWAAKKNLFMADCSVYPTTFHKGIVIPRFTIQYILCWRLVVCIYWIGKIAVPERRLVFWCITAVSMRLEHSILSSISNSTVLAQLSSWHVDPQDVHAKAAQQRGLGAWQFRGKGHGNSTVTGLQWQLQGICGDIGSTPTKQTESHHSWNMLLRGSAWAVIFFPCAASQKCREASALYQIFNL